MQEALIYWDLKNGFHFVVNIGKYIFLNEKYYHILIEIQLNFVLKCLIDNMLTLA